MTVCTYPAEFLEAVKKTLKHEGGLADDKDDPGGITNFGVSLRFALTVGDANGDGKLDLDLDGDGDVDPDDIRKMEQEDAVEVYYKHWWLKYGYDKLPQMVGAKVFDLSINMGARQAHKILQRALNLFQKRLTEDGVIGPKTLAAAKSVDASELYKVVCDEAAWFYRRLAAQRPKLAKFLKGWLRRAYA